MRKRSILAKGIMVILMLSLVTGCGMKSQTADQKSKDKKQNHIEKQQSDVGDSKSKEEEASASQIHLVMVGDILLHDPVEYSAKQEDGSYDFHPIFSETKEQIEAADLALVNQEVIIGGQGLGVSGYPAFNAPYEIADALVDTGFDVICHGTNHALDKGKSGLQNCMENWNMNYPNIAVLGIHNSAESQQRIYVYEQEGIKIAILNYTYGTNGIALPADMPYGVDYLSEERVISDIEEAEELADFTVVCPHWGTEYQLETDASQEKWKNIFLEHGVDLVIGTHPHVIEPIEMVVDEENNREMLVYYSLGNFVNWTGDSGPGIAKRAVGGMADVTLERKDDKVSISDYGVAPVVSHLSEGTNGVSVYFLKDYTKELGTENLFHQKDVEFSYDYCVDLCNQVWGDLWKD